MFHEFPKMLYQGDAQRIVDDEEQEKVARVEGWHSFGQEADKAADTAEAEPARRGRPPKADKAAD